MKAPYLLDRKGIGMRFSLARSEIIESTRKTRRPVLIAILYAAIALGLADCQMSAKDTLTIRANGDLTEAMFIRTDSQMEGLLAQHGDPLASWKTQGYHVTETTDADGNTIHTAAYTFEKPSGWVEFSSFSHENNIRVDIEQSVFQTRYHIYGALPPFGEDITNNMARGMAPSMVNLRFSLAADAGSITAFNGDADASGKTITWNISFDQPTNVDAMVVLWNVGSISIAYVVAIGLIAGLIVLIFRRRRANVPKAQGAISKPEQTPGSWD